MDVSTPGSARLTFRRLTAVELDAFHALAVDEHIRRYLLDGECVSRAWCADLIAASDAEFARTRLGMWLLFQRGADERALGFAGFWRFDGVGGAPQLLYALRAEHTNRGFAREAAVALIDCARAQRSLDDIDAAVDEPNTASRAVLTRLGFAACGEAPGAFGRMIRYRLARGRPPLERRTERLTMRPFRPADLAPFAAMNADPRVMEHFPAPLTRAESDALAARIAQSFEQRGYGSWALELSESREFIGCAGLDQPSFTAHFTPCVEVGWRLAAAHWGFGYATEAARAALFTAFVHLGLAQVVSFTARQNVRSQRVMERLAMRRDPAEDFDHPGLREGHLLRRHVLYRLDAPAALASLDG